MEMRNENRSALNAVRSLVRRVLVLALFASCFALSAAGASVPEKTAQSTAEGVSRDMALVRFVSVLAERNADARKILAERFTRDGLDVFVVEKRLLVDGEYLNMCASAAGIRFPRETRVGAAAAAIVEFSGVVKVSRERK